MYICIHTYKYINMHMSIHTILFVMAVIQVSIHFDDELFVEKILTSGADINARDRNLGMH